MKQHLRNEAGFALAELIVASVAGAIVLLGLFSLYRMTVTSFDQSSSRAALQRQGTLALQAIQRQALRASTITVQQAPGCAPANTTGRTLAVVVNDTAPPSIPTTELGTYCYYGGNGSNGAVAGALCERLNAGTCRNLLEGPLRGLVRQTGRIQGNQTGIGLVLSPSERCPRNSRNDFGQLVNGGQVLPNERQCLAFDQGVDPPSRQTWRSASRMAAGLTVSTNWYSPRGSRQGTRKETDAASASADHSESRRRHFSLWPCARDDHDAARYRVVRPLSHRGAARSAT